jgi:hypothetical protein
MINDNLLMRSEPTSDLSSLPIPENDISTPSSTRNVFPIRTETDITSVSSDCMSCESLLLCLLERSIGGVDQDLVI